MTPKVLGVDLDGCLVNFNEGLRERLALVTGRALIEPGFEPPKWNYPVDSYGYTEDEYASTWKSIEHDRRFWYELQPLPGAIFALVKLAQLAVLGHEVYFITSRPGIFAHQQSHQWISDFGFKQPTVLIDRGGKGPLAAGLRLTHFVDDRPENCFDVWNATSRIGTKIYMPRRSYNVNEQKAVEIMNDETRRWSLIDGIDDFIREVTA